MQTQILIFSVLVLVAFFYGVELSAKNDTEMAVDSSVLVIKRSEDFEITGEGRADNWETTNWVYLTSRSTSHVDNSRETKVKVLYSGTGIYFLFECEDSNLTASMNADFMDLWKEDVVEVFLWPDESTSAYFEYEISPLDFELPLLISNQDGQLMRWQPFHYETNRKTKHATSTQGGNKISGAKISGWKAEFFIPYTLLRPLRNIAPKPGTRWRANLYRVDYDNNVMSWSWQMTGNSFHDYKKFGHFVFE